MRLRLLESMIMRMSIRTCRLGDLIRQIQTYVQLYDDLEICARFKCKCGNDVYEVSKTILSLMDCDKSNIKLVKEKDGVNFYLKTNPIKVALKYPNIKYIKSKFSNLQHLGSVCFFHSSIKHPGRYHFNRKFLLPIEYDPLIDQMPKPIFNISDLPISDSRVCNIPNLSLLEKFIFINNAEVCYGVDTGLAHLALMTHTPLKIFYPNNRNPSFDLPPHDNLEIIQILPKIF